MVAVHGAAAGAADAYRMAARLGDAGKNLKRQLDRAGREASSIIITAVTDKSSTDRYIPEGFEARLHQSLQAKTVVRLAVHRTVTVVVTAMGKRHLRELDRIDAGVLRAPVQGRTRRVTDGKRAKHPERIRGGLYYNPWATHRIRPGVITEPAAAAMPRAVARYQAAAKRVADKINGV